MGSFSTSIGSLSIGGLPNSCSCMGVSSESIWHDKWSDEGQKLNKIEKLKKMPWQHQGVKWKDLHLLLSWKHRLFQLKLAPFEDQPIKVQLVLNQMPGTTVPHPEQIGPQCLITMKK